MCTVHTPGWNEEISTKYNNISSTDHTFYVLLCSVLLDVFFLRCFISVLVFHCSVFLFIFSFFAAIQNERVNGRIFNSHPNFFLYFCVDCCYPFKTFIYYFSEGYKLVCMYMSICINCIHSTQRRFFNVSFAISAFLFQCSWMVCVCVVRSIQYTNTHQRHFTSWIVFIGPPFSLIFEWNGKKIIHIRNSFALSTFNNVIRMVNFNLFIPTVSTLPSNSHKSNACEVIRCPVDHREKRNTRSRTHTQRESEKDVKKRPNMELEMRNFFDMLRFLE